MFSQPAGAPCELDCLLPGLGRGEEQCLAEGVRRAMMRSVDEELAERMGAAWRRGARATQAMQTESDQSFGSLVESLQDVRCAQQSLESENERLRQVIGALAGRLSQLSTSALPSPWSPGTSWASTPTELSPVAGSQAAAAPAPAFFPAATALPEDSPGGQRVGAMEELWQAAAASDASPQMVGLPAFPFQSAPAQPAARQPAKPVLPLAAAKVSLADVLGISDPAPPETPSTARSSAASSEASAGWSSGAEEVDAFVFGLTLRRADGSELGLTTSQSGRGRHLRIEGVLPGGAAEAWNRQCGSSGAAERVLLPGDKIVGVNDVAGDPQAMLHECSSRRLLRLQVVRVGCSAPPSPRDAAKVDAPPAAAPSPAAAAPAHADRRAAGAGGKALWRL